jgi:flagellar motility protein MotE (MotC chaperone)
MNRLRKHFRLVPAVLILGTALLTLKGIGIVHDARAQGEPQANAAPPVPADDAIRAPKDIANDDSETASAGEVDVLSSLSKRRAELDSRAHDQDMRENVLAATEKRVDDKIAALKALQANITALLGQRDAAQEKQVASLVKTYSSMKPKDAARIFDGLSDDVLIPVAQEMKSDALAPVLAAMNPEAAQKLTVKLASRLNVPDKAPIPATAAPTSAQPPVAAPGAITPQAAPPQAAATPGTAPQTAAPQSPAPSGAHG